MSGAAVVVGCLALSLSACGSDDGTGTKAKNVAVAPVADTISVGAPVGVRATVAGDSATVAWEAPTTQGSSQVSGYLVYFDDRTPVEVDAGTTSYVFTAVKPGQSHYVQVVS